MGCSAKELRDAAGEGIPYDGLQLGRVARLGKVSAGAEGQRRLLRFRAGVSRHHDHRKIRMAEPDRLQEGEAVPSGNLISRRIRSGRCLSRAASPL